MKGLEIVGVKVLENKKEVAVSLFGGDRNAAGSLYFWIKDDVQRHDFRRRAEALMEGNVLVDLAFSMTGHRWRLIGKNREILGGLEPTRLEMSQTVPKEDKGGLGWPEAWGGDE